ncbi:MAG: hypothetical protein ABJQ84_00935 [Ekhidna sp.]|uniref:hypothetical protein n=1 Tax=Ekhidna sp. TaxID=2608089 RepID=UPI0032972D40
MNFKQIAKPKYWDYFILAARFLIGWTFLRYGYSKLMAGQFGLSETELLTPIPELSPFRISWYLFDLQPFKNFIGISQIICGLLLIWNRTAILGAFMFLPIVATILIMDVTFMPTDMANTFTWRLSYYIALDILILWHYNDRMLIIWNAAWKGVTTRFKYPIWVYLTLPIVAIILEFISPRTLFKLLTNPVETIKGFGELFTLLIDVLGQIF